ncbi:hypothetical protein UlMin_026459 [Ulmus minor]
MEISYSRRHTPASPSPRLVRSRSGSSAITSLPATSPGMQGSSQRFNNKRSNSTTKTRPTPHKATTKEELEKSNYLAFTTSSMHKSTNKPQDKDLGFAKFLSRGTLRGFTKNKSSAPPTPPPSAWALSPGRSLQFASPAGAGAESSPGLGRVKSKSSGVNGVLKYFRQKKVSPLQEEEFHRFKILHNRLLQWRFANARAELVMAATKTNAESKLFHVWLRIFRMRNFIVEKRIQMQKLKHEIKIYQILNPQIHLLYKWEHLEKRNQESVGKLATKLKGISVKLPLIHGAKAEAMSIYEAISTAMDVMDGIEAMISKYFSQVEGMLYMVTELLISMKQQDENYEELEKTFTLVATLVGKETSVRAHYIQAAMEL